MTQYKLTIEKWHPRRLNELVGVHWGTRYKRKQEDYEMVGIYAHLQKVPPATGKRRVSLIITLAPRQRAGDPDSYWKSLLDSLVTAELLVNDSRTWCELGSVTFERGPNRRTTITLEDLP